MGRLKEFAHRSASFVCESVASQKDSSDDEAEAPPPAEALEEMEKEWAGREPERGESPELSLAESPPNPSTFSLMDDRPSWTPKSALSPSTKAPGSRGDFGRGEGTAKTVRERLG